MSADPKNFELELVSGNVKAAMKAANGVSADLWKVARHHIRIIPGFNVRITTDPEYIAQVRRIADSIKLEGFYNDKPLTGYVSREDGVNYINVTDGHTRLAAVDLAISEGAEVETLPVVVTERGTTMEDLTVRLVTANSGKPLTPSEIGLVCKRLLGYGMAEQIIAQRLGITKRYMDDLLLLVGAPRSVRDMVNTGKAAATMAIETLKTHGEKAPEKMSAALKTAESKGKSRITKKDLPKTPPAASSPTASLPATERKASKAVEQDPDNGLAGVFDAHRERDQALCAAFAEWRSLSPKEALMFRECFRKVSRHFEAALKAESEKST